MGRCGPSDRRRQLRRTAAWSTRCAAGDQFDTDLPAGGNRQLPLPLRPALARDRAAGDRLPPSDANRDWRSHGRVRSRSGRIVDDGSQAQSSHLRERGWFRYHPTGLVRHGARDDGFRASTRPNRFSGDEELAGDRRQPRLPTRTAIRSADVYESALHRADRRQPRALPPEPRDAERRLHGRAVLRPTTALRLRGRRA